MKSWHHTMSGGFISLVIFMGLLLCWELSAYYDFSSIVFFPSPSTIILNTYQGLFEGELAHSTIVTVTRIGIGTFIGGILGLLVGLVMGLSSKIRSIIDPFVSALHPIPKIALLPVAIIFFGIGGATKVVIIAFSAFFPICIDTMYGVRQLNSVYFDVAKNYKKSQLILIRDIVLPGSLPSIITGARIALNSSFLVTISVEIIMGPDGLGSVIWRSWETFNMANFYSALLVIVILGTTSNAILEAINKQKLKWVFYEQV